jgi:HNH endonuclease
LRDLLSQIKGVFPNAKGSSLNHKFEYFQHHRNVVNKKTGDERGEYAGWGFCCLDKAAFEAFVNVCTAFQKSGLLAAEEAVLAYELKPAPRTAKLTVLESRVGQQQFKKDLLKYWKTCAVTDCSLISVLKASHIKAWTESTPVERLDPFNGLLLSPNLDCLFDSGLVSFDKDGAIMISSKLDGSDTASLGVNSFMKLRKKNGAHEKYLEHHRKSTFKK